MDEKKINDILEENSNSEKEDEPNPFLDEDFVNALESTITDINDVKDLIQLAEVETERADVYYLTIMALIAKFGKITLTEDEILSTPSFYDLISDYDDVNKTITFYLQPKKNEIN